MALPPRLEIASRLLAAKLGPGIGWRSEKDMREIIALTLLWADLLIEVEALSVETNAVGATP